MWFQIAFLLTFLTTAALLYVLHRHNKLPKIITIFNPVSYPYFDYELIFSAPRNVFSTVFKSFDDLRPVLYANLMALPHVFVTDLDDLSCLLRVDTERPASPELLVPWLGQILLNDGCPKLPDRISGIPNDELLTDFSEIANRHAFNLTQLIDTEINKEHVEMIPKIYLCVLDIMCEASMGVDVKIQSGRQSDFAKAVLELSHLVHRRQMLSWLLRPYVFNLTPTGRKQNSLLKKVFAFTEKVIMSRMMERELCKSFGESAKGEGKVVRFESNDKKSIRGKRNTSYLQILLKKDPNLPMKEALEEVNKFIFPIHDKTSASVVWTLFELGHNPEVQELAYLEQRDIFQSSYRPATADDLSQMTYLDRIIKETFRLYPSTPIVSRRLKSDVTIHGYEIPAGTDIPIFVYYIHRNPELYPNPEQFNPDRFLPDKTLDLRRDSYTPLIFGPRYCFAEEFAIKIQKIIVSHILRHFTIMSLDQHKDLQLMGDFIIRPKTELRFSFKSRLRRST